MVQGKKIINKGDENKCLGKVIRSVKNKNVLVRAEASAKFMKEQLNILYFRNVKERPNTSIL